MPLDAVGGTIYERRKKLMSEVCCNSMLCLCMSPRLFFLSQPLRGSSHLRWERKLLATSSARWERDWSMKPVRKPEGMAVTPTYPLPDRWGDWSALPMCRLHRMQERAFRALWRCMEAPRSNGRVADRVVLLCLQLKVNSTATWKEWQWLRVWGRSWCGMSADFSISHEALDAFAEAWALAHAMYLTHC